MIAIASLRFFLSVLVISNLLTYTTIMTRLITLVNTKVVLFVFIYMFGCANPVHNCGNTCIRLRHRLPLCRYQSLEFTPTLSLKQMNTISQLANMDTSRWSSNPSRYKWKGWSAWRCLHCATRWFSRYRRSECPGCGSDVIRMAGERGIRVRIGDQEPKE